MFLARNIAAAGFAAALALGAQAARISSPPLVLYGQSVSVELRDMQWPTFLPATRYMRAGSTIVIDYEYSTQAIAVRSDFVQQPFVLGELVPGNYILQARLIDMLNPTAPAQVVSASLAVAPPDAWGIYLVPQEPEAFTPWDALIRSAAYFDPNSMRVTFQGNVVRVDFDYRGDAPVGGSTPPGWTSFAAARVPPLAPGTYFVEGWGRDRNKGIVEKYFSRQFTVSPAVPVIEYYADSLDHYFIAAGPDEVGLLDSGARGWKRSGQRFKAWLRLGDGPPDAMPVCRFYASGPNSHFYTGDARECDMLKALERQQRADAATAARPFLGWQYEGIAFYAILPQNGQCPGGTKPVYRAYNNRAGQMDSNHRFTADPAQRAAMAVSWIDEGVAFCSPP